MDNKLNNMLNEFLENVDVKDEKELNEKLQDFFAKYNAGEIEYENTPLDDAYELLGKAEEAEDEAQALKYAKQAYKQCPECFDALLFQVEMEENPAKRWKLLNDGLEAERKRLEGKGYFKDGGGHFYGIYETRPYMKGLSDKSEFLATEGKLKQARDVCKEALRLNKDDNLGIRFRLMAIYAVLEEEKEMLKLYGEYQEEDLEMLLPLFILYFKLGDDKKAREYLNKVNKVNKHFVKFFKGMMTEENKSIPEGYYSKGDVSEIFMYFQEYMFLLLGVPTLGYYVIENSKKK